MITLTQVVYYKVGATNQNCMKVLPYGKKDKDKNSQACKHKFSFVNI